MCNFECDPMTTMPDIFYSNDVDSKDEFSVKIPT